MAINFKGAHFPPEVMLMGIRWYVAYPLSTRHVEELMQERGVVVDHATVNGWVIKYSPQLEEVFHRRKRPVWISWRLDETYIKVKGQWRYLYRAVDKNGQTIDFLLTEHRATEAALRFLKKAIRRNGVPETITIDGSDANEAAIKRYNEEHGTSIIIRQVQYLNAWCELAKSLKSKGGFTDTQTESRLVQRITPLFSMTASQQLTPSVPVLWNCPTPCVRASRSWPCGSPCGPCCDGQGQTQGLPSPAHNVSVHARGLRPRQVRVRLAIVACPLLPSACSERVGTQK